MGAFIFISGCPGTLQDPDAFFGSAVCEGTDVEELFQGSCGGAGCHGATDPAADLDLVSPNVESRLVNVSSIAVGCEDRELVMPGDAEASYLLAKVDGDVDICGSRMPFGRTLDPRDIDCIRLWVEDLSDGPGDGGTP